MGDANESTADVVHLDFLGLGGIAPQLLAQLAVTILPVCPRAANDAQQLGIIRAFAHGRAQINAPGCKKTGIELAFRGQPRAAASSAKRLRNGRDEADLAAAVVKAPTP